MKDIGIIAWLRLGAKLKRVRKIMMSEIGEQSQRDMAAQRANRTVPDGQILVVPAKAPTKAAGVSTASTAAAGSVAGLLVACLNSFVALTAEQNAALVVLLTAALNFAFSWYRHRRENATAPGVGPPV